MMVKQCRRLSWVWLGLLCLLCSAWAPAQIPSSGLDVRPADESLISREPRAVVSTAFRIHNGTDESGQFEAQISMPLNWRPITPEIPFKLAAGENTTRIVSFHISEDTPAGDYEVVYEIHDRKRPSVWNSYKLLVRVLPLINLQVDAVTVPDLVISGEPYDASFVIQNNGNTAIQVNYRLRSSLGNTLKPDSGTLDFAPGEAKDINVKVQSQDRQKPENDILTLTAEVTNGNIRESSAARVKILPRVTGRETPFHTIPTSISLGYTLKNHQHGDSSGWQAEIRGGGTLDEAGEHHIGFYLRGPDIVDKSSFGSQDEYWFSYWNKDFSLHLGDKYYTLSPLTELGRYGFGADVNYWRGDLQLHAYHMRERFDGSEAEQSQQSALGASYALAESSRIHLNYLNKQLDDDNQHLLSLRGELNQGPMLNLDVEYALSRSSSGSGQAGRGYLSGTYGDFRYVATLLHADPDFQGYYRDQQYAALEFSYAPLEFWGIQGYYRYSRSNLDAEAKRTAPEEYEWSLGTGYRFSTGTRVSLDYRHRERTDRRALSEFDTDYQGVRINVSQQFDRLSFTASGEWGITQNNRDGSRSDDHSYRLAARWRLSDRQTYGAYYYYQTDSYQKELDDGRIEIQDNDSNTVGISADYRITENTQLNLNLQKAINKKSDYDSYDLRFTHQFNNNHQLALNARHTSGIDRQTEAMLTYKIPLDVPIRRRKDVASVSGRVFDSQTGQGLANLALVMGDLVAISDANGSFKFPSVKLGTYALSLRAMGVNMDKVPAAKLPMTVDVRHGANNNIGIPMVTAATISGRVIIYETGNRLLSDPLNQPIEIKKVSLTNSSQSRKSADRKQIEQWVHQLAPDYGLDPRLVLAVIEAESNFNPSARSPKNAQGLMQLIPATANRFGVRDVTDPRQNLQGGMAYLRWLLAYFKGDVRLALAGYNAGEGAVEKHRGIPPYPETQAYVTKITRAYGDITHPPVAKAIKPSAIAANLSSSQTNEMQGLPRTLIVLRSGEHEYKRLTDSNGGFRISGLPSGQWTISANTGTLPENFRLESDHFTVDITPGQETTVEFKVVPRARKLKMLKAPRQIISG